MLRRFSRSSSDWPFDALHVRDGCRAGSSLPSAAADQRLRQARRIEADRVRQPHAHRDAAIEQPQIGRHVAEPGGRQLLADAARRSARTGRRPPDRSSRSLRDCRCCMPTTSTTPSIFSSISSTGSASVCERAGVVAEDLHFDRRRRRLRDRRACPAAAARTRSPRAAPPRCSFGRRSLMIVFGGAVALAARLEPHQDVAGVLRGREQAELRSGAARIRRDFRRVRDDLLHRPHLPIGFARARCRPASGSR